MKALFVACDQAMYDSVMQLMDELAVRGFTGWEELIGRGSATGDPHLGSHAWPAMNSALIAMVEDEKAAEFLARLRKLDEENPNQGLRAFAWNVSDVM
ncbi:MAG: hypothetical protein II345_07070 [Alistipes sp.]|jgi:hypothetical protein|nr:hypothetical protein [Alistipes sp.]MBQ1978913.1 hypothetical protein [Alistipes sp.]MBQ5619761.1 hypothetical protein [Alistipes sp.]MBQ5654113.1 hypothetical protein [Alistipes sp.]MBQ5903419.1 hypothetical protein [Alistipes sp.]